ncbi:MAG: Asp-tRNA(Asn)/Glu-tRNA(Gln) amidotransferase subunit GatC [Verrucomicrobiota bacterium]|nr:Asp-tRNA(Asn)/Glu-tRNA(Gln) amidotransferase subunit GatC [Verrucomicrobiota bacterium]
MSTFDRKDFEHLKKLCRIQCSSEEEEEILGSLQRVLDYMEQLKEVDTEGVPSCNYVLRSMLINRMRPDEVKDILSRDTFLANAPEQVGGMVRVPPVLKPQ